MTTRGSDGKPGDVGSETDEETPASTGTSEQALGESESAVPETVQELAMVCVDYVERALGITLDFTEETLPILDHYATVVRSEVTARPEVGSVIARAAGAYFGEVLRGKFGGFWRLPSDNVVDWSWCARAFFLAVNPIGCAYDALHGADTHDGPSSRLRVLAEDRGAVDARLASIPPVPEDEYFRFTTRIEVIEVAAVTLRARMSETGYDGIEFDEGDYAAEERQF
jgi:hypothetical protein